MADSTVGELDQVRVTNQRALHVNLRNSTGVELGGDTPLGIQIPDSRNLDAFDRLRVSTPTTLFDTQFQYGLQALLWETVLTAGGTAVHAPNESAVLFTVSSDGDAVVRQTHRYFRYQPGKSQAISLTCNMGVGKADTRKRIGYFDASNGLFFEQDGVTLKVVRRSFASGAAVDVGVAQSSWNIGLFC